MIGILTLSYYLDKQTYQNISQKYDLTKENTKKAFDENPILGINLFSLHYERWGDVYFFYTTIDLNRLYSAKKDTFVPFDKIDTETFCQLLAKAYQNTFGQEITEGISKREHFYCTYIEYNAHIKCDDADILMEKLKQGTFTDEQLDINCFHSYRLKNAFISFTINKIDKHTIRLCAKCPNTALKKIFKISGSDEDGNIAHTELNQVLDKETAANILYKQVVKFTKPQTPIELSKENILAAL
ncbi:hypothetical protein [Anaerosporobacter sp.]|uniref:hypothetical protein n=1 Tax=Anaerosporobacter sp. TaxID=1872529 RepID=UPI00286EBCC3|nr:hypothetical protein [Anaerosporobacter sp.]